MTEILRTLSERRALQLVMGAGAVLPLSTGLYGMLKGPQGIPGGGGVPASIDNQFAFVNAFWFASGIGAVAAVPRIEEKSELMTILLGTAFVGGLARTVRVGRRGHPHPVFVGAWVAELAGMPLLWLWHRRVANRYRRG
ncbi:DUF4345 domain-containing protein [Nocardia sp. NPDC052316]|uniref:DUF4345 domain-containing protein n=1 Tax=Nocardia sp. NPDC052316 TaxID=3364329 RepID=UPI0037C56001